MVSDRVVGTVLLSVSTIVFVYYSVWVLVTPFVDGEAWVGFLFPDRYYALIVPITLLFIILIVIFTFIALVMIRGGKRKKNE